MHCCFCNLIVSFNRRSVNSGCRLPPAPARCCKGAMEALMGDKPPWEAPLVDTCRGSSTFTAASMRNEVLWNEAREPDYRRILSQGPLVKKAAQFMLRTRLLGQFRTLPPSYRVSARLSQRLVGPQFACSLAPINYADPHALSPSGHRAHCTPCI